MEQRKRLSKSERMKVYEKYQGRCAYCGYPIAYEDMQVDHLIPIMAMDYSGKSLEEVETMDNYMPTCRMCNHYKRGSSLEGFRGMIETIPFKLERDSYIFRVGRRYGNVKAVTKPVRFYFEEIKEAGIHNGD